MLSLQRLASRSMFKESNQSLPLSLSLALLLFELKRCQQADRFLVRGKGAHASNEGRAQESTHIAKRHDCRLFHIMVLAILQ